MGNAIKKVTVNGESTAPNELRKMLTAMCDKRILMEKGGYLFSVSITTDHCVLGIQPYQIHGERKYHYDLNMPMNKWLLTGFINSTQSISIIFKPTSGMYKNGLSEEEKNSFYEVYIKFARFLIEHGFSNNFEIDFATKLLLTETGILEESPGEIGELARLPAKRPATGKKT